MEDRNYQHTLVAWLGDKPEGLTRVVESCRESLATELGQDFEPYALEQIHATVVGLERVAGTARDNANMKRLRGLNAAMEVEGFLATLRDDPSFPIEVVFGGFARGARPLASRGRTPWERSFSIQGDKAVLIGWPVVPVCFGGRRTGLPAPDRHPPTMDRIRRRAEAFNILHAYHPSPGDVDNDVYLRLGHVHGTHPMPAAAIAEVETTLRDALALRPVTVPLSKADLRLARYRDAALPPATTSVIDPMALTEPGAWDRL